MTRILLQTTIPFTEINWHIGRFSLLREHLASLRDENGNLCGRGIAESSFHHLVDYNWDISKGCPDFVEEAPGDGLKNNPERLEDVEIYAANLAKWLAPD